MFFLNQYKTSAYPHEHLLSLAPIRMAEHPLSEELLELLPGSRFITRPPKAPKAEKKQKGKIRKKQELSFKGPPRPFDLLPGLVDFIASVGFDLGDDRTTPHLAGNKGRGIDGEE